MSTPRNPSSPRKDVKASPALDRLPPHDEQAERGVLGCVLLDASKLDVCLEKFKAEVFYDLRHQRIYNAMVDLRETGQPVDVITLQARLKQSGELEQVGGLTFITSLPDATPSAANIGFYADIVVEQFGLRQMLKACAEVTAEVYEIEDGYAEFMDRAEKKVLRVRNLIEHRKEVGLQDLVRGAMTRIEEYHANQGRLPGLTTGFKALDLMTCGLNPADMVVVAARPSVGKSSICMQIAEHVAVDQKLPVAVFSLEMSAESLTERMLASRAKVNLRKLIRNGLLTQGDITRLTRCGCELAASPLWIEDEGGLSILQLRAKARRLHQQHGIKLIVIDYLQLLHCSRRTVDNRQQEVAEISSGVKALAKELKIPVIICAQLNRGPELDGRPPRMSDLRESGAIEQDADLVLLLHNQKEDEEESAVLPADIRRVGMVIAKQRNGPTGDIPLVFDCGITRFYLEEKEKEMPTAEDVPQERRYADD